MRFVVGVLACIGAVSFAVADPPSSSSTPTPATTPAATAPASAPTAAPAAQTTNSEPAAEQAAALEREKHFLAEGYKMEMRHGEKVFCRREEMLGSRLNAQKVCSTAQQLTRTETEAQASVTRSMMQQSNPTGH